MGLTSTVEYASIVIQGELRRYRLRVPGTDDCLMFKLLNALNVLENRKAKWKVLFMAKDRSGKAPSAGPGEECVEVMSILNLLNKCPREIK